MVKKIFLPNKKEKPISIKQYNKELNASIKQIETGEIVSHEDVVKNSAKWFKRK